MDKINKTMSGIDKGDFEIRKLTAVFEIETMYNDICNIAEKYNVDITDNARKIAKARVLTKCPLNLCICDRDDKERGCISPKCMKEIEEDGICHCKLFRKKDR